MKCKLLDSITRLQVEVGNDKAEVELIKILSDDSGVMTIAPEYRVDEIIKKIIEVVDIIDGIEATKGGNN